MSLKSRPSIICLIFLGAALLPASTALAGSCRDLLKSAFQHFNQFHQDPTQADQAVTDLQSASADPSCAYEAQWNLANLYLNVGTALKDKKDKLARFKLGQESALKAIALNPNGREGHYFYAVNLGSQIDVDGVMKNLFKVKNLKSEIEKSLALDPNYAPALVVKASYMHGLPGIVGGSDKQADELYRKALKADPTCESAYLEYASFLIKLKRLDEAKKLLEDLQRPNFPHSTISTWVAVDKPKLLDLLKRLAGAQAENK